MMNFRDLVEKAPDTDLLREMIGFAAERLMELEVGTATGAGYGEKDPARRAQASSTRAARTTWWRAFGDRSASSVVMARVSSVAASSAWLLVQMWPRYSRYRSCPTGPSNSRCITSENPITAFSGVRIS